MTELETARSGHVVIRVDTHKHVDVAVVMDSIGGILATLTITTDTAGLTLLLEWATGFGAPRSNRPRSCPPRRRPAASARHTLRWRHRDRWPDATLKR